MTNIKVIESNGSTCWYDNGQIHREDGPAIIYDNGGKEWCKRGKRHRDNGPAIICSDNSTEWWLNDKLHRENGPASIYSDGTKQWYIHGNELTEEQFNQILDKKKLNQKLEETLLPKPMMKRAKI